MKFVRLVLLFILVVFVLPVLLSGALWWIGDNPRSWREANWSSSGVLPRASEVTDAVVYVMAARTGGIKGAISEHSWLVLKDPGESEYERWDVVGWGNPLRRNGYDADARWYSNTPYILAEAHGEDAERLIPKLRAAIDQYRFSKHGDYRIFPGPNSNTFVASVLRDVPELPVMLSPVAVGRDYPADGELASFDRDRSELRASLFGYAGIVIGPEAGLEINFLGLVAGINPGDLSIKIPAFGTFSLT
ncbi:DUF3750 domain-containing protein [Fulvimarina sp. 2208YS6-2-32]|uniref:DUF3750 domain-containing protein n=1 Tax=Fulvimarina uroteuthidis TaxID=3098149 RepID=A0ABU5I596_9HYPH|nr:DUF3750 domain-containing protein [Fulvimarina sp. 2208YS6-2-32]MDY8110552.1 DUF3750 domain-containing protein [Fulvimarina sp. 2208YS6-2-32]